MAAGRNRSNLFILFFFVFIALVAVFFMFYEVSAPTSERIVTVEHEAITQN